MGKAGEVGGEKIMINDYLLAINFFRTPNIGKIDAILVSLVVCVHN